MPYADPQEKKRSDRAYGNANRDARAARAKRWREKNPHRQKELSRRSHLMRKFGMTLDDYDAMLESQGGVCAICGTDDTSPWEWFCIDHDHGTGAVRGLLCRGCNTAIGQAEDNVDRLRLAIAYLERPR